MFIVHLIKKQQQKGVCPDPVQLDRSTAYRNLGLRDKVHMCSIKALLLT